MINRRRFLQGSLCSASGLVLASSWSHATGLQAGVRDSNTTQTLRITRRIIEVNGRAASVFGLERTNGTPGLEFNAGDLFSVVLRNETNEGTIVHWHGLTPTWYSDGVAG